MKPPSELPVYEVSSRSTASTLTAVGSFSSRKEPVPPVASVRVVRVGRLSYEEGLSLQADLVTNRRAGLIPDTLALLEHEPVITLGRGADPSHVLLDKKQLVEKGIALFETGRGGDVTVHSPGQAVGYPVLALEGARRDTHRYLRDLEEVMIRAAADFGVGAQRESGLTGIWVSGAKLGAIGVRLNTGWITSHGFAFNVCNDLSLFRTIVPCGLDGRAVTSLSRLTGRAVDVREAMDRLAARFLEVFAGSSAVRPDRGIR
jgi:lipoyl(octanoyl) transferase